jgi:hypothetical protein
MSINGQAIKQTTWNDSARKWPTSKVVSRVTLWHLFGGEQNDKNGEFLAFREAEDSSEGLAKVHAATCKKVAEKDKYVTHP